MSNFSKRTVNIPPPCKGCPDRHPGCHDACERFAEWKSITAAAKQKENEDRYFSLRAEMRATTDIYHRKRRGEKRRK